MSTLPSWFRSRCAPVRARQRSLAVRLRLLTAGAGDKWPPPLRFTPTAEHLVGEALNVPRQVGHVLGKARDGCHRSASSSNTSKVCWMALFEMRSMAALPTVPALARSVAYSAATTSRT